MIKLDISILVFFYTFLSVVVILAVWIFFGNRQAKRYLPKDSDFIWKCSVCSHIYIDSRHEDISACPLCGSYNKKSSKNQGGG